MSRFVMPHESHRQRLPSTLGVNGYWLDVLCSDQLARTRERYEGLWRERFERLRVHAAYPPFTAIDATVSFIVRLRD